MLDRYTKAILTVIAAALAGVAVEGAVPQASAQGELACGTSTNPCYVFNQLGRPLEIHGEVTAITP